jgi:23S rRNA (adenine2503-C2)-methyltransferase
VPVLHLAGQDSRGLARAIGIDLADARRILGAVVGRGRTLRDARNVRREVLDLADARCASDHLDCVATHDAKDGFRKYLFRAQDGATFESVRIPLFDTHHTLCLSSQAGCALACAFCATGRLGLTRNLEPWEMVDAFLRVRDEAPGRDGDVAARRRELRRGSAIPARRARRAARKPIRRRPRSGTRLP